MFSQGFLKQATTVSRAAKTLGFEVGAASKAVKAGISPQALKAVPVASNPISDVTKKAIKTTNELSPYAKASTAHVTERNYAKIPDYAPATTATPDKSASKGFMARLFG